MGNLELANFYDRNRVYGSTDRFREMDRRERYWKGLQYAHLEHEWDLVNVTENGGFAYETSEDAVPLRARKPSIKLNKIRQAVQQFTGYLFGTTHVPQVRVVGNEEATNFCQALLTGGEFWLRLIRLRNWGGGVGSAAGIVKAINGRIRLEIVNPKTVEIQSWEDPEELLPRVVEMRWLSYIDYIDKRDNSTKTKVLLNRRLIDQEKDVTFVPTVVTDHAKGSTWKDKGGIQIPEEEDLEKTYTHDLGICPVVFVQNTPPEDDDTFDGLPDCHEAYCTLDAINRLLSQCNRALLYNLDPTLILKAPQELIEAQRASGILKGSFDALNVGPDGDAFYAEINGGGVKLAMEMIGTLEKRFERQCHIVLPDLDKVTGLGLGRDVLEFWFTPMLNQVGILRQQYGRALERILSLALKLARDTTLKTDEDGNVIQERVELEPVERERRNEDGSRTVELVELTPGEDRGSVSVTWPRTLKTPSLKEIQLAGSIVRGLADRLPPRDLVKFISEFVHVQDPGEAEDQWTLLSELENERQDAMSGIERGKQQPEGEEGS